MNVPEVHEPAPRVSDRSGEPGPVSGQDALAGSNSLPGRSSVWGKLPVFWKLYLTAVLLMFCIIVVGEASEEAWSGLFHAWNPDQSDAAPHGLTPEQEIFVWLAASVLPPALGCLLLARVFTGPLRRLTQVTSRLAAGELSARPHARDCARNDEFGRLAQSLDFMAARLEDLLAAERRLLMDMSHELRSPLARMGIALALVRRGETAYLDRVETEMGRMEALVSALLERGRREVRLGQPLCRPETVDLWTLALDVADEARFEGATQNKDVEVFCEREEQNPSFVLRAYPDLLRRAVDNVVRNALRHTPPGSVVTLTLRRPGLAGGRDDTLELEVRDQGPGVPPEALPHLLRPFYRVDEARDRDSGGSGLGLALADEAVRLHGGSLRLTNGPDPNPKTGSASKPGADLIPGRGLRVTLSLPEHFV